LRVPAGELLITQVRYPASHPLANLGRILVEVQLDATHALALEEQYACVQRSGLPDRGVDARTCASKIPCVNTIDDGPHDRAGAGFGALGNRWLVGGRPCMLWGGVLRRSRKQAHPKRRPQERTRAMRTAHGLG